MIDGRHCNLCYLDIVAGGSQCSDYYPGGSLLPDSDNDGLWMFTQLVTVVTMTNLHCSRYMTLCQLPVWWPGTCNGLPGVSTGVLLAVVCTIHRSSGKTLGYKYFVIVGFPVIRFPQRAK